MSFKNFSAAHATPSNDKLGDKIRPAPAVGQPAIEPSKKQDDAAPAEKL